MGMVLLVEEMGDVSRDLQPSLGLTISSHDSEWLR